MFCWGGRVTQSTTCHSQAARLRRYNDDDIALAAESVSASVSASVSGSLGGSLDESSGSSADEADVITSSQVLTC